MKKILSLALLALSFAAAPAFAEAPIAAPAKAASPQTTKMSACATEYHQKSMAQSEYRKFMTACLKKDYVAGSYVAGTTATPSIAKPAVAAVVAAPTATSKEIVVPSIKIDQKDKMKQCNKTAGEKTLKGAERRDFMKSCLSAN